MGLNTKKELDENAIELLAPNEEKTIWVRNGKQRPHQGGDCSAQNWVKNETHEAFSKAESYT